MIIFLPIEIKTREFLPKLFLALNILNKTNHKVVIGGQRFINYKIKSFENCIWLDKYTPFERLQKRDISNKNKVFVLDEEGPVSIADKFTKYHYQKNFFKLIDTLLLWGINDKSFLNLSSKVKTFLTGHPKFDLVKENKHYFRNEVKYILKKYKKFIFIPGHHTLRDRSIFLKRYGEFVLGNIKNKNNIVAARIRADLLKKDNYIEFLNVIKEIAKENPKKNFVFRHHPMEDKKKLNDFFKNKPKNLFLEYKFSIVPWIISCEYFLHGGCTTSFEAAAINKKILYYQSKKVFKIKRFSKLKLSNWNFNDAKKLSNFIKSINLKKKNYKLFKDLKFKIFNGEKKQLFYNYFIKLLKKEKLINESVIKYKIERKDFIYKIKSNLLYLLRNLLSEIKNQIFLKTFLINLVPEKHLYGKEIGFLKFKSIEKKEIIDFFKKTDKKYRISKKINVKKISKSVYLLYK